MCGVYGFIGSTDADLQQASRYFADAIKHRGPDSFGDFIDHGLGVMIGMTRLSIIDLENGYQPMHTADKRYSIVFNGEIYNFHEIRRDLEKAGQVFLTSSDTEVVLNGYAEWGAELFSKLNGMFAAVVLDRFERTVTIARDRFGVKPLYFYNKAGRFIFCSEPMPLVDIAKVNKLSKEGLVDYLTCKYIPSPGYFLEDIQKLEPATYIVVGFDAEIKSKNVFWQPDFSKKDINYEDAVDEFEYLLDNSIKHQTISDVPVGLFISGGIDSGLLANAMYRNNLCDIKAINISFSNNESYNEAEYAKLTADSLNVELDIIEMSEPEPEDLNRMISIFGEPFANISVPANFLMCEAAAKEYKVMLNGSGADELMGGYDRYYAVHPPRVLTAFESIIRVMQPLIQALPDGSSKLSLSQRLKRYAEIVNKPVSERHAAAIQLFNFKDFCGIYPHSVPGSKISDKFKQLMSDDMLSTASYVDMLTMMVDDYLNLVDRTSMSKSLEVRVPYLDNDLVDFTLGLPSEYKIKGFRKKRLMRDFAAKYLPDKICSAPKQGFESPVGSWFKSSLRDTFMDMLHSEHAKTLFNTEYIKYLYTDHCSGKNDRSKQLLGIYTLLYWMHEKGIKV